jgi:hypothetical protein
MLSVLQIPDPYNYLVQVRFKHNAIYESYFSKWLNLMQAGIGLIEGVHIESEAPSVEKFKYMPFHIGYDNVLGYIALNRDGEVIIEEGDIEEPNSGYDE